MIPITPNDFVAFSEDYEEEQQLIKEILMNKILIETSGGSVVSITTLGDEIQIYLIDHDNKTQGKDAIKKFRDVYSPDSRTFTEEEFETILAEAIRE
jgi:hypothetical protein